MQIERFLFPSLLSFIIILFSFYLSKKLAFIFPKIKKRFLNIILTLSVVTILVGFFGFRYSRYQGQIPTFLYYIQWVGFILLGIFSFTTVCFLIADMIILIINLSYQNKVSAVQHANQNRRKFLLTTTGIISILLSARAFQNAIAIPKVKKVTITIKSLHPDLKNLNIVQLTDFHIGQTIGKEYVEKVIEKVNALNPDIVVITGDLIDGFVEELKQDVAPLAKIKSKYGFYYITGNHEYYWDPKGWIEHIKSLGAIYFHNEHTTIQIGNAKLLLAGVTDYNAERYLPEDKSDPQKAILNSPKDVHLKILLAHQPKSAFAAQKAGFDVQISGHTHGGQFWPWIWLIHFIQPFVAGLSQYKNMKIYVSKGTGYWGVPARLGADSEITYIKFI